MGGEMLEVSRTGTDAAVEHIGTTECINLILKHQIQISCHSFQVDNSLADTRLFCPLPDGVDEEMEFVRLLQRYSGVAWELAKGPKRGIMSVTFEHDQWIESSRGWEKQKWTCLVEAGTVNGMCILYASEVK
jgi:hypothetical protein